MASFASEVKNELARLSTAAKCCRAAELAALLRMGASMAIGPRMMMGLNFTTENAAIARRILHFLKEDFSLRTEVVVSRARRLKKNNSYTVKVVPSEGVRDLLTSVGFFEDGGSFNAGGKDRAILRKTCCRQAYLRGAFLGGGSVNRPESAYHMELVTGNYGFAKTLFDIMRRFGLPVGITDRKNDYIIYLKEAEAIADFLSLTGANETLTEFEVARNLKDVRNQVNRLVNCETANLQKTVNAAVRQLESIRTIERLKGLKSLPQGLFEAAKLRLENPEANLQELVAINENKVSKSGMNHRLRKLEKIAAQLQEESLRELEKDN